MLGPVGEFWAALVRAGKHQINGTVVKSNTAGNITTLLGSQSFDNETTHDKGQVVAGGEASRGQLDVLQIVSDSLETIRSGGSESTAGEDVSSLLLREENGRE